MCVCGGGGVVCFVFVFFFCLFGFFLLLPYKIRIVDCV